MKCSDIRGKSPDESILQYLARGPDGLTLRKPAAKSLSDESRTISCVSFRQNLSSRAASVGLSCPIRRYSLIFARILAPKSARACVAVRLRCYLPSRSPPLLRGRIMTTLFSRIHPAIFVALALAAVHRAEGQVMVPTNPSDQTVLNAAGVLSQTMTMQSGIPQNLLAGAQGIVIVPNMIRGAFVFGAQYGRGVLLVRNPQGGWQAPRLVTMAGGSFGYQIGVQATDLVLVFRTPQSVANLLAGTLKLGVDASAAAGPVGRQTSAATDLQLGAEILSYSRARGLFAGVSLDGSVISLDPTADALYYQPPGTMPASAMQLLQVVNAYSACAADGGRARSGRRRRDVGATRDDQRGRDPPTARCQLAATGRQSQRRLEEISGLAAGGLHGESDAEPTSVATSRGKLQRSGPRSEVRRTSSTTGVPGHFAVAQPICHRSYGVEHASTAATTTLIHCAAANSPNVVHSDLTMSTRLSVVAVGVFILLSVVGMRRARRLP